MNSPEWLPAKGFDKQFEKYEVPLATETIQPTPQVEYEGIDGKLFLKKKDEYLGVETYCLNCDGEHEHIFISRCKESEKTETTESIDKKGQKKKVSKVIFTFSEFVRCSNCMYASIRRVRYDMKKRMLLDEGIFIPKRINRRAMENPKNKTGFLIDREVYILYEEAVEAYNSRLNFSSGAAIRSIIETICKVIGIRKRIETKEIHRFAGKEGVDVKNISNEKIDEIKRSIRLEDQVRELIKKLMSFNLPKDKLDVLQEIRDWGNNNIHHNKIPTTDDLNNVLTILEKIIRALFIEPREQEKFSDSISEFRRRR